jgi:hypothetical protein
MLRKLGIVAATAALAVVGIAALPTKAEAWWRGGWCCGVGIGVVVPPVVVAPPVYAAPPPAYYYPPQPPPGRAWIPAHWEGGYWVPGHWA